MMNRNELSIRLAQERNITKVQSDEIINTLFEIIRGALKDEGKVCIKDFGTFLVKKRKGRKVKAIGSENVIAIPDIMELKLRVSKSMKDYLNDQED
ncbi:MAG TPA: HU family DNA-binding protein [Clostridia bacterium]|jgi:nucleoid DNA-binding protein|nr:HU family DNA-binding protein [Clostridia bacterium]